VTITLAAPSIAISSPSNASNFTAGSNITITANASETGGTIAQVQFYNGASLLGSSSTSPYSYTWTNVPAGNYSFIAIAKDAAGTTTTSSAVTVTVTASSTPVVAITSPAIGSNFTVGSNVTITATASETSGTINKVEFFNGSALLGTATSSPYTFTWNNVAVGNYTLTAEAFDNNSNETTSTPVAITVSGFPVVNLVTNNTSFTAPAIIVLTASASEINGTISKVEFFNGPSLLGTVSSSPYTFTWNNAAAGNYLLSAEAFDNNNNETTSTSIAVIVSGVPSVNLTTDNTSYIAPASVTLTATASETNGTISQVQFYNGTNLLGTSSTSPYSYTWNNVPSGSYSLIAKATDANNVSMPSTALAVTVSPTPLPPSITTQPANETVTAPSTATFTVAATGVPAPSYQWMQSVNGGAFANINGATSASYTTGATTTANSGTQYECVVTNGSGSVTSNAATLTVNPTPVAPSITTQPVNAIVTAPATATFTVAATGTPAPSYQWMQSVNGGAYANINGATSTSYTTSTTTVLNSGTQYECVVTNASGSLTSSAATLTVNPTPVAPSITTQPVSTTVTAPAAATFTVAATGVPAPSYQWMQSVNGGAYANINGATSASYTTLSTTLANSGTQYECVVTNGSGSVTSNAATLTVDTVPGILTQPASVTVTAGATATFTVAASGAPAPNYQWMQSVNGGSFTNINGATSSSYTTGATAIANSGTQYECVVTNASGSLTSSAATLTVNPTPVAPSITTQPVSTTVTAPAAATFTVAATGVPAPSYQWMQSVNGGAYANINGATSASYTTLSTTLTNSGTQYECVVTNGSGSVTSNAATLTVDTVPGILTQPASVTVTAGATASFSVTATGTPAPSYQWQQKAPGAGPFTAINNATSASYTTGLTAVVNSGTQYECVVTNASGSLTSSAATLTVNPTPVAPSITTQPVSTTVTAPAAATFTVAATGVPAPSYQWMQSVNGGAYANINGATSASYTTLSTTLANSGTQYECVVTNGSGSVTSNAATLTVDTVPGILTQPASVTVTAGATATFTVAASGAPAPNYQWLESVNGGAYTNINGATSASYITSATTLANSGTQYECVVTNGSGSVTSNAATLTVDTVPNIITQPVSVTVTAPATATFTLAATGTPAPSYQWMQSVNSGAFASINGATSASYTTGATTTANSGTQYECVVTNASGTVTSSQATLTVTGLPNVAITSPADNSTLTVGPDLTITASANETNGTITTVFFYNGPSLLGSTSTPPYSYTITNAPVGTYILTALATDQNDNSTTSIPITVTVTPPPSAVVITSQPASVTVSAPASATFSVTASGYPAPSFQWLQESPGAGSFTAISGATSSSYTTPATATANNGTQYECVASNASGSATSTPAVLTVKSQIKLF